MSLRQVTQVTDNAGGQTLGYTYNGQNDVVFRSRTLNGVAQPAVSYLNDPTGDLSQLLAELPASGAATYYVPGQMGQDVGGVQTWFAKDGLESVRALFNTSAAQVGLRNFDPYGTPLESNRHLADASDGRYARMMPTSRVSLLILVKLEPRSST